MYLLFTGYKKYEDYRKYGGWHDFRGTFPSVEECLRFVARNPKDWYQIVDSKTFQLIEEDEIYNG